MVLSITSAFARDDSARFARLSIRQPAEKASGCVDAPSEELSLFPNMELIAPNKERATSGVFKARLVCLETRGYINPCA
jgi:hypothetical protein